MLEFEENILQKKHRRDKFYNMSGQHFFSQGFMLQIARNFVFQNGDM